MQCKFIGHRPNTYDISTRLKLFSKLQVLCLFDRAMTSGKVPGLWYIIKPKIFCDAERYEVKATGRIVGIIWRRNVLVNVIREGK